jgi:hypothetical protein
MDFMGGRGGREIVPPQGALSTHNSKNTETTEQIFSPPIGNRTHDLIFRTAEGITLRLLVRATV